MYGPDRSGKTANNSPQGLYGAIAKPQSAQPLGFMSQPNSSGQYSSPSPSRPKPVPQATPGPIQRSGSASAPAPSSPSRRPRPGGGGKHPAGKGHKGKTGIPSVDQYLAGDSTYQGQYSSLQKALEDYKNQYGSQTGIVNQDFATALQKLQDQRTQDVNSMKNDYAARGLLNSGLFTDALGQYDTKYQQQYGELGQDQQRSLADLLTGLQGYQSENAATLSAAKQDAIRRRAAQYGIS